MTKVLDTIDIEFTNQLFSPYYFPDFPVVFIGIKDTDLIIGFSLGCAETAEGLSIEDVQKMLENMFGPLEWREEGNIIARKVYLFGRKSLFISVMKEYKVQKWT